MAKAKINLLKNMVFDEVSLVVAPMCPGADVLFTKGSPRDWRTAITGDVQVNKADVSQEPRDKKGRWTTAAINAIGGKQGSYRREMALAFRDKAKALAHAAVGHTVKGVLSTRFRGADPVMGGGVQFNFEHHLGEVEDEYGNKTRPRITTKVQIRPEHLGAPRTIERVVKPGLTEAHYRLEHKVVPNKAHLALRTLHRVLRSMGREQQPALSGSKRLSFMRAEIKPEDLSRAVNSAVGGGGTSTSPPAGTKVTPMSTETGGFERRSTNGMPVWSATGPLAGWEKDIFGAGNKPAQPKDKNGNLLPLPDATHKEAASRPYYRNGAFIPNARPSIQRGIETVHDWLARNPGIAAETKAHLTRQGAHQSGGREYFTPHGDYIPPGEAPFQMGMQRKYTEERDRVDTALADERLAEKSPREKLFGANSPGGGREAEYDLGTEDQRRAAASAFRMDQTRKSLFFVPPDFPITKLPPGFYTPVTRWSSLNDGSPSFASRDAGDPPIRKARKSLSFG